MEHKPHVFGIRHLSPAGAWFVRDWLDRIRPELLLIEGPSDFTELMDQLTLDEIQPPFAVMAYTQELPVRTILYPFSIYSPEYQAILWAKQAGCPCRFCDLPSDIFLGIPPYSEEEDATPLPPFGEEGTETFWERFMEHAADAAAYERGALEFGRSLRELTLEQTLRPTPEQTPGPTLEQTPGTTREDAENLVREAYMRRVIQQAAAEGFSPDKIAVITGAFHREGLLNDAPAMTDQEFHALPRMTSSKTLMPYSYFRLSERAGYGAGNSAPAYFELLWESITKNAPEYAVYRYLSELAGYQRDHGMPVSSAEVIEATRLAYSLASLHDSSIPALRDLRDAAVTCMGHGSLSELAAALAATEIGTRIGSLPEGISRTSIQADFYRQLKKLRLEKYKTMVAAPLDLDLREKLTVKSKEAAFLDLERSFFLHRLRILGIPFAAVRSIVQDKATWAEGWTLQWTPEAEIRIVESVLKGDTVLQAAAFVLRERIEAASGIADMGRVIEEAFLCGMPAALEHAIAAMQHMAVDAVSIPEIAKTTESLSLVVRYGDIRRLDRRPLMPILSQLFLRACLFLPGECACDDAAAKELAEAILRLDKAAVEHEVLDRDRWNRVMAGIAARDDLNTRLSGLAAAILLEKGLMDGEELGREVERRLSKGIPASLGAGWFEGLSMKNHYALIARMNLWEKLSQYLDTLDDEEFKRALIFLRRAFADFSAMEKDQIAENLGEIWQLNPAAVSEFLNAELTEDAAELLSGLDEFDFDDI